MVKPGMHKSINMSRSNTYRSKVRRLDITKLSYLIALSHDDTSFIEFKSGNEFYPDNYLRDKPVGKSEGMLKASIFTERGIYRRNF